MVLAMRATCFVAALFIFPGLAAADEKCPAAQPQVEVETIHGDVEEFTDTTVAELAAAAKRHNAPLRHPIVGVYISTIAIGLNIKDKIVDLGANRRCSIPEVIYVRLGLTGRAVHLPRDFADNPCLMDVARTHQHKHAEADRALINDVVVRYMEQLRARMVTLQVEPASSEQEARLRMTEAARNLVKEQLDSYEDMKQHINQRVDAPEEVVHMRSACGETLSKQDGL
jgi:hypothetical protein